MCSKWPSRRICWTQKSYCATAFVCLYISFLKRKEEMWESNNVELYLASKPEQQPPLLAGNPQLFGGNKQTPSLKGMRSTTTMLTQGAKTTTTEGTRMKKTAGKVSCFKRESKVRAFCFQTISWQTNFWWQLICSYLSSQFGWLTDVITAFPFKCSQFQQIAPKSLFHFSPKSKRKENGVISISVEKKERRKLKVPHQNDYM